MSIVRFLRSLARNLFRRRRVEADLDEELRGYVDALAAEQQRAGLAPAAARRAALATIVGVEHVKEAVRDARAGAWLDGLWRDLAASTRSLRRSPGFTAVATVTLATGVALTTAMFGIVHATLLEPLPYRDPGQLVRIVRTHGQNWMGVTGPEFVAWRREARRFTAIAATFDVTASLTGTERTDRVRASAVTGNLFAMLGVRPLVGRDFQTADEASGAAPVAMLSYTLWRDRFASDSSVVGRTIRINGGPRTVIGVMPAAVQFPHLESVWLNFQADPVQIAMDPTSTERGGRQFVATYGRLASGVTPEAGAAELTAIEQRVQARAGNTAGGFGAHAELLRDDLVKPNDRQVLILLLGVVFCVLLIACANVANLLLDRAVHRIREVGVRTALGASRAAVARHFLAEALAIAAIGTVLGLGLATLLLGAFNASALHTWLPQAARVRMHAPVAGFAALLGLVAAAASGVVPAWQASRVDVTTILNDTTRGASSFRAGRLSRALVTFEIALSCVLLVATGLMLKSARRVARLDPGFTTHGIFTAELSFPQTDTDTAGQQRLLGELLARLGAMPGARGAALATSLPGVYRTGAPLTLAGQAFGDPDDAPWVFTHVVSPGFFATFEMPILEGRGITTADLAHAEPVAVVSRDFADRFFPGRSAVGARIRLGSGSDAPWRTVVGVVPATFSGMRQTPRRPQVFVPLAQAHDRTVSIAVRGDGDPLALAPLVRAALRPLDPDLPLESVASMDDVFASRTWEVRTFGAIITGFGAIALVLATAGLYAVMAFAVSRRTREVGIRIALGARHGDVARVVFRQGLAQIGLGTALGLFGAYAAAQVLGGLLFEVQPRDPLVFAGAAVALGAAAALACLAPVRRATRVDPLIALRAE